VKHCFITATGTDVGKTIVTAGLVRALRNRGLNAVTMKPVQTGIPSDEAAGTAEAEPSDLDIHLLHGGYTPTEDERKLLMPYAYEPACSPHLAGRLAGRYPDVDHIVTCATQLASDHEVVLAEGAGGILAPIDEERTMLDVMVALGWPVLLVAHRGLGTINHTLLSIEALRRAGLDILGVVFNETEDAEPDFIKRDNPETVAKFGSVRVLGDIDYLSNLDADPEEAWSQFEACCPDLMALWTFQR
jgi:dethiobiotin synthetase